MPQFDYTAVTGTKIQKGTINAPDRFTAYKILKENGFSDIRWTSENSFSLFKRKPSIPEFFKYFDKLTSFLEARMPLEASFTALENCTDNATLKKVTANIKAEIKEGTNISEAFEKQNIFPNIVLNLMKLGNVTSGLHERTASIAHELRQRHAMNNMFSKAFRMPIFIMFLAICFVFVINKYVIPTYQKIYTENKAELPFLTKILFKSSGFMVEYWYLLLLIVIAAGYFLINFTRNNPAKIEMLLIKTPFIKKLYKGHLMYVFSSNLFTLLDSGLKLQEAIKMLPLVISSNLLKELINSANSLFKEGEQLSQALKEKDVFNLMNSDVLSLLAAGEESTQVKELMQKTAKNYFVENDERLKKYIEILEPSLVLFFGCIFGLVIFAVQAPYFNLIKVIIKH